MFQLCPEQLCEQLNSGLHAAYWLIGNDPLLLQESYDEIRKAASTHGFGERYIFHIDSNTDWQEIFLLFQTINLFTIRQIVYLVLPENGFSAFINAKLEILVNMLHDDILLIMQSNRLIKFQKKITWFTVLYPKLVQVICLTPCQDSLSSWIVKRAKRNNLQIDYSSCQLLCRYYEGNLLALAQILDRLPLLWPSEKITVSLIQEVVNNSAHFKPFHWVDAILMAKSNRAFHILQQLRLEGNDPVFLVRTIQYEILVLLKCKRELVRSSLDILFDKYHIWENKRSIFSKALYRLSESQLRHAVYLLTRVELAIKQNYDQLVWCKLETLSLLLCCKVSADVFIYG